MTGATGMLVGASSGTVHADLPDDLAHCIRAGLDPDQNPVPSPIASPTVESVSARLPWPIAFGEVTPLPAASPTTCRQ